MNKHARRKAVLEARKAEKAKHKHQYLKLVFNEPEEGKPVAVDTVWADRFPLRKDKTFNENADTVLKKSKVSYTRSLGV